MLGVKRRILGGSDTEVRQPSLKSAKVSQVSIQESHVDQGNISFPSAADYSNATLTENANGNDPLSIGICQADTAVTVNAFREDHSYSASAPMNAALVPIGEDHSYHLKSPKTLKKKSQATEKIVVRVCRGEWAFN